ncbi:MAG TPA: M81 family metallopeptidase [Thermomicrobiales bacterium]|nr:M81 family metallopeptidase [Thermomicrobiales bacterium]
MRLALLGYYHETNTFSPTPTDYARFERSGILRGEAIVREHATAQSTVAGFLELGGEPGIEVVPLMFASTGPLGLITKDAYDRLTGELLDLLATRGPWDGVLLALHGAAVSEEHPDADAAFTERVRALVGPDLPVGVALDLHANLTERLVANSTVTILYRTNPHLDARARARECGDLIVRTIRGEIRPAQALETPPLVVNIVRQCTGEEPMRGVEADVDAVIARPGILSAGVAMGYPYADVPGLGMAFLAIADGDPVAARDAARWLAERAWDRRADFVGDTPSPDEAIAMAVAFPERPVVLMDVGDNIGGGSPADSTVLLEAALRLGARDYLQTLYDPEAVRACIAAGVGATVTLAVGGKTDDRHGAPVTVTGRVRVIADGRFEDPRPTHGGWRFFDGGPTVGLECPDGYTLVLTSERIGNTSIEQMYSLGIRPEEKRIVVAKGVVSPRPAYEPIAGRIILVNTPGVTSSDLSTFTYYHRRRPLYPFEGDATYEDED